MGEEYQILNMLQPTYIYIQSKHYKWVTPHTSPHKAFREFPAVTDDCFDLLRGVLF